MRYKGSEKILEKYWTKYLKINDVTKRCNYEEFDKEESKAVYKTEK